MCGDAPPERAARRGGIIGQREAVLIGLVAIGKDILRDLPEVDEERAATCCRLIDERIHQPALEVVNTRLVEVRLVYPPCDPGPAALGLGDIALGGEGCGIEVVGAALPRVVAKGERREIARLAEELLAVGIELRAQHVADEVVADEVGIIAYVGGGLAAAVLREYRVDAEPREQCSLAVLLQSLPRARAERHGGSGEVPAHRVHQVDATACLLEVVQAARPIVIAVRPRPCVELGELPRQLEARGRSEVPPAELIEPVGQAHALGLVAQMRAPHGIAQQLLPYPEATAPRLLAEVHEGRAQLQLLAELVVKLQPHEVAVRHRLLGGALQRDLYGRITLKELLVEDAHLTRAGVEEVVDSGLQLLPCST